MEIEAKKRKGNYLEVLLASNTGRRFLNYAYSWGAAVVIIGAMCKILHLPAGNMLLMIGMIAEAAVFIISGFDNLPAEEVPAKVANDQSSLSSEVGADTKFFSPEYNEKMTVAAQNMEDFGKIMTSLNEVSLSLLTSYKQIADSTQGVSDNSINFAGNIKDLNTNVSGLNEVYESQLQSISNQIATVKYINESLERIKTLYDGTISDSTAFREETAKMTKQIEALNKVYARLLQAMTSNNNPNII